MKNLIYLSVLLSVWSLKLNAQDIDFPLLQSEIEKYESRVHIQRLPNVYVTHPDVWKQEKQCCFPYLYHGMSDVLPTLITNNDSVPGNYLPANTR